MRRMDSERAPGVWPEIWLLMATGQRASLRKRREQCQGMLSITPSGGGDPPPVTARSSVEGWEGVGGWWVWVEVGEGGCGVVVGWGSRPLCPQR